jgi:hypothetical protein
VKGGKGKDLKKKDDKKGAKEGKDEVFLAFLIIEKPEKKVI